MSRCVRCDEPIEVTKDDPLIATRKGPMHYACFQKDEREAREREDAYRADVTARRREAGRRAWRKREAAQ
jgi:hypothetical protein